MPQLSLQTLEESIEKAKPEDQQRLLARLPFLLKINFEDLAWLKQSEQSFKFWDNPDDAVYDRL